MRVGLFCKTCAADLRWFRLALASFRKYWRHPDSLWTVVFDRDCGPQLIDEDLRGVRQFFIEPWPDRYCHAMAMKACADLFTGCELVLMFDSDMMMTRPTELDDLLVDGRPCIYFEEWNNEPHSLMAHRVWGPASMRSTGRLLDRDYMRAPLWIYWASTFQHARKLVEEHTRVPFLQAVYSSHPYDWHNFDNHPMSFCDMENLAMAAQLLERSRYNFIPVNEHEELPVKQFWSHSDFGVARLEMVKILDP